MTCSIRGAIISVLLAVSLAWPLTQPVHAQAPIDVYELADYRLTTDVFERFLQATERIGTVTREDSAFTYAPLFTKDVALSGDAVAEVKGLVARLENHPGLAAALSAANITAREYAKFALTLIIAHLAHGFLTSGVLPRVPEGAPTNNVAFVKAHEAGVASALAALGIRD
jgi:hypothetical protein